MYSKISKAGLGGYILAIDLAVQVLEVFIASPVISGEWHGAITLASTVLILIGNAMRGDLKGGLVRKTTEVDDVTFHPV